MPIYFYKAVDKAGNGVSGEVAAESREEATSNLSKDGYLPIIVEERRGGRRVFKAGPLDFLSFFNRINTIDKILMVRYLASILKAGLSLTEALKILHNDAKKPALKQILKEAKEGVENGQTLSSVFENHPENFSAVFAGLVKAGEESGNLDNALENLANQLFRDYDLLKKVRLAMIYPLILLFGSAGIIVLMMVFVLPRMAKAFSGVLGQLPAITRFFIKISSVLSKSPALTILIFIGLVAGLVYLGRSPLGKRLIFKIFERLPISSELMKKMALSRFSRTFKNLLASGVSALEAIEISAGTVGNPVYEKSLLEISSELKKGAGLAASFKSRSDLYPDLFGSLIMVGEHTGTLEKSLENLSAFYDEEVDRLLKNLVAMLEPMLLLVMGLIVALVAMAVLLPIFKIIRILQPQ